MEIFNRNKKIEEINQMSPLTWAYVGDCVYELYIRTKLVDTTRLKPHELHIKSIKYVKAKAQAETLKDIENSLTEEEEIHKLIILLKMQVCRTICMQQHLKL